MPVALPLLVRRSGHGRQQVPPPARARRASPRRDVAGVQLVGGSGEPQGVRAHHPHGHRSRRPDGERARPALPRRPHPDTDRLGRTRPDHPGRSRPRRPRGHRRQPARDPAERRSLPLQSRRPCSSSPCSPTSWRRRLPVSTEPPVAPGRPPRRSVNERPARTRAGQRRKAMSERRQLGVQDALWLEMDRPTNLMVVDSWSGPPPRSTGTASGPSPGSGCGIATRCSAVSPCGATTAPGTGRSSLATTSRTHFEHVELSEPGDDAVLQELIGSQRTVPLDRDKPLWKMFCVDGFRGRQRDLHTEPPCPRRRHPHGAVGDEPLRRHTEGRERSSAPGGAPARRAATAPASRTPIR